MDENDQGTGRSFASRLVEVEAQRPKAWHGRVSDIGENRRIGKQDPAVWQQLLTLSGPRNPYPGKLGVIEEGAYAET